MPVDSRERPSRIARLLDRPFLLLAVAVVLPAALELLTRFAMTLPPWLTGLLPDRVLALLP